MLALKGNQSGTQDDMQALFNEAMECDFKGFTHDVYTQTGTNHGRIEERTCHAIEIPEGHHQRERWKDLRTLAVTVSCREINGEEHWESRSYISSLPPDAESLGNAIRKHWAIENSQHWVLDVAFDEDRRRQRDRNGAANLAAVRRLAASLLRQEQTLKRGTKCKRMACTLDPDYLMKVLQTANF